MITGEGLSFPWSQDLYIWSTDCQALVYPMVLGILGFCDAKDSRSVLKQGKNTISFQIYKYLAMPVFSGGGVNVYFVHIYVRLSLHSLEKWER